MRWRNILFDLDGTITDSAPGITNSIIYARKKWGMEPGTNADYYKFIGPSIFPRGRGALSRGLPGVLRHEGSL